LEIKYDDDGQQMSEVGTARLPVIG